MSELSEHDRMVEEVWRNYLTTGDVPDLELPLGLRLSHTNFKRMMKLIPTSPRCTGCYVPFHGIGAPVIRLLLGRTRSRLNPQWCNKCEQFGEHFLGGAEVELSMLFADIRGSTSLAQEMSPSEFSRLINRFYKVTSDLLIDSNAMIEKLIGDEVAGLYLPGLAGTQHACAAVETARAMLQVTGHDSPEGPWVPVGIGVHTGVAFVGSVGSKEGITNFTALGDAVNIAARLASVAGPGEILVSEAAYHAAGLDVAGLETRSLELKGRDEPISVHVLHAMTPL